MWMDFTTTFGYQKPLLIGLWNVRTLHDKDSRAWTPPIQYRSFPLSGSRSAVLQFSYCLNNRNLKQHGREMGHHQKCLYLWHPTSQKTWPSVETWRLIERCVGVTKGTLWQKEFQHCVGQKNSSSCKDHRFHYRIPHHEIDCSLSWVCLWSTEDDDNRLLIHDDEWVEIWKEQITPILIWFYYCRQCKQT